MIAAEYLADAAPWRSAAGLRNRSGAAPCSARKPADRTAGSTNKTQDEQAVTGNDYTGEPLLELEHHLSYFDALSSRRGISVGNGSPSAHIAPSSKCSFFQIGTVVFSVSMSHRQASNAAARCADETVM